MNVNAQFCFTNKGYYTRITVAKGDGIGLEINKSNIIELLKNAINENIDSIKTENLYSFDGKVGYSLGQGQ